MSTGIKFSGSFFEQTFYGEMRDIHRSRIKPGFRETAIIAEISLFLIQLINQYGSLFIFSGLIIYFSFFYDQVMIFSV
ncbi:hypothetical protein SAMN05444955_102325 [Lihuaxuella thermophila]|uniref:Uncharacterized protein n=1 Tax=Lihuaxuella thermophila TaxID=1173111 RepID=A0A1H8BSE8_9BACL|nr:hypothetical protein SAMN05444955_102325 [Lihuaxuella thermophila]